jgi:hypothetical protein
MIQNFMYHSRATEELLAAIEQPFRVQSYLVFFTLVSCILTSKGT